MIHVLPMGDRAVLVGGLDDPAAWALGLRADAPAGVVDVVPAAETVLVSCADSAALAAVSERLAAVRPVALDSASRIVTIPVRYDGDDLDAVARATALSVAELIERHARADYVAAFCGFSPGFAYLRGLPPELHLPRRPTPRTRVPAGSVAIAAGYSAVYPRQSPGGWHLIGTTDIELFDPTVDPPALLQPGTRVRFEPQ